LDDPNARLAGFANPKMAEFIDAQIEEGLSTPGAEDVTARYRVPAGQGGGSSRKTTFDGGVFIRPTIVRCDSFAHALANREFLCPYASVVKGPQAEMLNKMGYTLACTAITRDASFIEQLLASPDIERLNLGPVSTMTVSWDQPHEGNMFEFLYRRRSIAWAVSQR
jgi:acyl-CoA reductase-like NAD-dependent aldehyde dehydrogenase